MQKKRRNRNPVVVLDKLNPSEFSSLEKEDEESDVVVIESPKRGTRGTRNVPTQVIKKGKQDAKSTVKTRRHSQKSAPAETGKKKGRPEKGTQSDVDSGEERDGDADVVELRNIEGKPDYVKHMTLPDDSSSEEEEIPPSLRGSDSEFMAEEDTDSPLEVDESGSDSEDSRTKGRARLLQQWRYKCAKLRQELTKEKNKVMSLQRAVKCLKLKLASRISPERRKPKQQSTRSGGRGRETSESESESEQGEEEKKEVMPQHTSRRRESKGTEGRIFRRISREVINRITLSKETPAKRSPRIKGKRRNYAESESEESETGSGSDSDDGSESKTKKRKNTSKRDATQSGSEEASESDAPLSVVKKRKETSVKSSEKDKSKKRSHAKEDKSGSEDESDGENLSGSRTVKKTGKKVRDRRSKQENSTVKRSSRMKGKKKSHAENESEDSETDADHGSESRSKKIENSSRRKKTLSGSEDASESDDLLSEVKKRKEAPRKSSDKDDSEMTDSSKEDKSDVEDESREEKSNSRKEERASSSRKLKKTGNRSLRQIRQEKQGGSKVKRSLRMKGKKKSYVESESENDETDADDESRKRKNSSRVKKTQSGSEDTSGSDVPSSRPKKRMANSKKSPEKGDTTEKRSSDEERSDCGDEYREENTSQKLKKTGNRSERLARLEKTPVKISPRIRDRQNYVESESEIEPDSEDTSGAKKTVLNSDRKCKTKTPDSRRTADTQKGNRNTRDDRDTVIETDDSQPSATNKTPVDGINGSFEESSSDGSVIEEGQGDSKRKRKLIEISSDEESGPSVEKAAVGVKKGKKKRRGRKN